MLAYLLIVLVVLIFYARTIGYSLVVDDIAWYGRLQKKPLKFGFKNIVSYVRGKLYGGGTFGLNTYRDHAFTTILHAVTCCLIYAVFSFSNITDFGFLTDHRFFTDPGFWAALLYAVNPYNNQTSIWLNGRRYQVVVILCLLALLFKPWGLGLWLLTPMFQLTGFFLPVLWYDVSPWLMFGSLVPVVLMHRRIRASYEIRRSQMHNTDQTTWHVGRLVVAIKSFGFYFFKMLYPGVTMMNYPTLVEWGVTKAGNDDAYRLNWDFVKGLCAFLCIGLVISIGELWLYGVFIFFGILQWSAVICVFQQLADRYMSLVNVFVMYVAAWILFQVGGSFYGWALCAMLAVYYATQLNVSMRMYRCIEDFYNYQLHHYPELVRTRLVYADTYLQAKDPTRAWLLVQEGLSYSPNDFELLYLAAKCSACAGLIDRAEEFLCQAEKNFYVGQEKFQSSKIAGLRATVAQIRSMRAGANNGAAPSRQVVRAQSRAQAKRNEKRK